MVFILETWTHNVSLRMLLSAQSSKQTFWRASRIIHKSRYVKIEFHRFWTFSTNQNQCKYIILWHKICVLQKEIDKATSSFFWWEERKSTPGSWGKKDFLIFFLLSLFCCCLLMTSNMFFTHIFWNSLMKYSVFFWWGDNWRDTYKALVCLLEMTTLPSSERV